MQFTPKSKDELDREGLLPKGVYDFTVLKADNAVSKKSGNPMIALNIKVYGAEDATGFVTDYLMEAMLAKMYEFCAATGILDKYHAGTLEAEDCEGRAGKLVLGVQEDKTGNYGPRNTVRSYVAPKPEEAASPAAADNEDSPFSK